MAPLSAKPAFGAAERKGGSSAGRGEGSRLLGAWPRLLGTCSHFLEKLLRDFECWASTCWVFGTECWVFGTQCWVFGTRSWVFGSAVGEIPTWCNPHTSAFQSFALQGVMCLARVQRFQGQATILDQRQTHHRGEKGAQRGLDMDFLREVLQKTCV